MQPLILLPILSTWNIQSPIGRPEDLIKDYIKYRGQDVVVQLLFSARGFFFRCILGCYPSPAVVANDKWRFIEISPTKILKASWNFLLAGEVLHPKIYSSHSFGDFMFGWTPFFPDESFWGERGGYIYKFSQTTCEGSGGCSFIFTDAIHEKSYISRSSIYF